MKKLASLLLALVMIMSCFSAMAANVANNTEHTYKAYQIFSGTQGETTEEGVLGDIAWGTGINSDAFLTAIKADSRFVENDANIFAGCETALQVANVLTTYADDSVIAKAFADVAAKHIAGEGTVVPPHGSATGLPTGYYLIIDVTDSEEGAENFAYNTALLQVEEDGDFTIAQKYDVPEVDKSVDEVDVNIGDNVTFTLTATMPSTFEGYDTYKVIFHDTLSDGLTFNNDVKVTVADVEKTEDFTVTHEDGKLTITFDNVLALGATPTSKIVVTYTATVNEKAEIGNDGNKNEVYLEYSNNPNWNGDGTTEDEPTGNTPSDEVFVFTYELDVTKTDGEGDNANKLKDAEFVLYREVEDTTEGAAAGTTVTQYVQVNAEGVVTGWTTEKAQAITLKSNEDGLFKVIGLDVGTYYLEETKAPAGYNLLTAPIKVVIAATYTEENNDNDHDKIKIETLTISVGDGNATDGNIDTGVVGTTVVNQAGATLPETGGMGTTILYVGGGILVLAAIVLLIVKRRANAE